MQTTTTEILRSKQCLSDEYPNRVRQNKNTPRKLWIKDVLILTHLRRQSPQQWKYKGEICGSHSNAD